MKDYTKSLNENNFNEAFQCIKKMTARNTRKEKIRNIIIPIGCIIFLAASMVTFHSSQRNEDGCAWIGAVNLYR